MIWADRVALAWAGVVVIVVFMLWAFAGDAAGFFHAIASLGGIKILVALVLPVWVLLRCCDLLFRHPRGV